MSRAPWPCGLIGHVICRIRSEDRGIKTRRQLENGSERPSDVQEIRDEFGNQRRHARETNNHRRVERARVERACSSVSIVNKRLDSKDVDEREKQERRRGRT